MQPIVCHPCHIYLLCPPLFLPGLHFSSVISPFIFFAYPLYPYLTNRPPPSFFFLEDRYWAAEQNRQSAPSGSLHFIHSQLPFLEPPSVTNSPVVSSSNFQGMRVNRGWLEEWPNPIIYGIMALLNIKTITSHFSDKGRMEFVLYEDVDWFPYYEILCGQLTP